MSKIIQVVSDSGHGWAQVDKLELVSLGIEKDISNYSYQRDTVAFLEEDSDLSKYCNALKANNIDYKFDINYIDGHCFVRNLRSYKAV